MSRPIHQLVVTTTTQMLLSLGALSVLGPTGLLGRLPWRMLAVLSCYNMLVAALSAILLTSYSPQNRMAAIKGAGLVTGHLVGLVLGGFLGSKYGGLPLAVIAAILLYFAVGQLGARISLLASASLRRLSSWKWKSAPERLIRSARSRPTSWRMATLGIPGLVLYTGALIKVSGWSVAPYSGLLSAARAVCASVSLLCIAAPWIYQARWRSGYRFPFLKYSSLYTVGTGFTVIPAVLGLLAYVLFGMPGSEMAVFALTACVAASAWQARR